MSVSLLSDVLALARDVISLVAQLLVLKVALQLGMLPLGRFQDFVAPPPVSGTDGKPASLAQALRERVNSNGD